jgi:uncharacterized protein YxjI
MSEYLIQQRSLSSDARTLVQDENGKNLFLLVGRWGSLGDVLSLYDMSGELLAQIKQASLIFGIRFDIYSRGEKVSSMRKILNWRKDVYYIPKLRWLVSGDITNHQYRIQYFDETVMEMQPVSMLAGQYYSLDIENEDDAPVCICVASVLDYWLFRGVKEKKPKLSGIFSFD